jgi:putative ABC transport system permease protein
MRKLLRRLRNVVSRRRFERELSEELAFHREMKQQEFESQGLPARDAAIAAQRALGNDALSVNHARDVWIWPWLQDLSQDARFAVRLLRKERRFSAAAILALALALGANTTAFTFVNGVVIRDLPLADPDRLVLLRMVDVRQRPLGVSYADVRDWRAARTLSHVITSFEFAMNVSEPGLPAQRYMGSYISIDAFTMVGKSPSLGRGFRPEDDRLDAPRVAVIAHTVWTNRYGSDPGVVGRTIAVNDIATTIIGVMPERFHFPFATEIWMPAAHNMGPPATIDARRGGRNVLTVALGRLADGATRSQAQAELDTITSRLARDYPDSNDGLSVAVESLDGIYRAGLQRMLLLVMGAVACVLLIACVNVANLLLARAANRAREIVIRTSLGGSRWRIVRQLFTESILLASVAGATGLLLAFYGVRVYSDIFLRTGPDGPAPFWLDFSIDARVFGFLAAITLGASVLFGLAPALYISKTQPGDVLKDSGRSHSAGVRARRWTDGLMIGQLALTLVLLAGAGLMARSFFAIHEASRVLDTSNVMTMRLSLAGQKYSAPERIKQFFRELDERLQVPALGSVTVASDIPILTLTNSQRQLEIRGREAPNPPPMTAYLYIGPRYFQTLRLRLIEGRDFNELDGRPGQEAVIVNQRFAALFFPNQEAIGQRIRLTNAATPTAPKPWFTIIGIAPTIPQILDTRDPEPVVYSYIPSEPAPHRLVSIIARSDGDPAAIVKLMRETVQKVDPALPGYFVQTLDEVAANTRWPFRIFGSMFALLAAMALVLASVGLYALTAHGVVQRTQEIGVRMALGAGSRAMVWMFVRRTMVHLAVGVVIGLVGAVAAGRMLAQFLMRTAPTDPIALTAVTVVLVVVATLASVLPARRSARVDPVVALRCE